MILSLVLQAEKTLDIIDFIIVQISSEKGCVIRLDSSIGFVVHIAVSVSEGRPIIFLNNIVFKAKKNSYESVLFKRWIFLMR